MFYLLIPKTKPGTTPPNVFCLGDGIGVTNQCLVEDVMGQLCCTSIHLNSKLFYWGLWHFTTVIMQNLTSCVLLVALGECALLLAFESTLLFELKSGHMHKDQDLSFISASCMVKNVSTTRESNCTGKIMVYVMEGSKAMAKSSTTRASLSSFQSTRWRGVSDLQKIKKAQMPMSSKTKTRQQFYTHPSWFILVKHFS